MRTRSIPELVAVIERTDTLRASHAPTSVEWQNASREIATLLEEMRRRTSTALGSAFAATLMGLAARDLDVADAAGARLLTELRKRGLSVGPGVRLRDLGCFAEIAGDSDSFEVG